jgi:hypothetical protein
MKYFPYNYYPTIRVGTYENYVQKIVARTEEELFSEITKAMNHGKKTMRFVAELGEFRCKTQGIWKDLADTFCIVQPYYITEASPKFPYYMKVHNWYECYIAFIPVDIINKINVMK